MNLRELRIERNLTQHDMARYLNCSDNKYASWEQGRTQPSIEDLITLADYFQVGIDFLVGHSEADGVVYSADAPALSSDEQELLDGFRQLNAAGRSRILGNVQGLLMASNLTTVSGKRRV